MGDVVSLAWYKAMGKQVLVMNKPCPRPFHKKKYVKELRGKTGCLRCNVLVEQIEHPSFKGKRWYG